MNCCKVQGIKNYFDEDLANADLQRYWRRGPARSSKLLVSIIKRYGVKNRSLLDIGGGVGAIQHLLAKEGLDRIFSVDISPNYLKVSQAEAQRLGYADRAQYYEGDFVAIAADMEVADIVTLDRVVCCYHDVESLVQLSANKARLLYCLVHPKHNWLTKSIVRAQNLLLRIRGRNFQLFIHSIDQITALVKGAGFEDPVRKNAGLGWQIAVYRRISG